jgi:hypothetical protein
MKVDELKTLLKFDGVDTSNFTDEELQLLINTKVKELEGLIGVDINPHDRTKTIGRFKGKMVQLSFYPVLYIARVLLNGRVLDSCEYTYNKKTGIVYFHDKLKGFLEVQYTTGLTDMDYDYLILPLIKDMVGYTITYGVNNDRLNGLMPIATSLKEGDVSVGFKADSNNSFGYTVGIGQRIDDLRNRFMFSSRVRWI